MNRCIYVHLHWLPCQMTLYINHGAGCVRKKTETKSRISNQKGSHRQGCNYVKENTNSSHEESIKKRRN